MLAPVTNVHISFSFTRNPQIRYMNDSNIPDGLEQGSTLPHIFYANNKQKNFTWNSLAREFSLDTTGVAVSVSLPLSVTVDESLLALAACWICGWNTSHHNYQITYEKNTIFCGSFFM